MPDKVELSIIVPVYNVRDYLMECLDSIRGQTFQDWECLCIDDGSTDGSAAILDSVAAADSRFKVWHRENAGVSAARNFALEQACGTWISFVDADDKIDTNLYKSLLEGLSQTGRDCDIIAFSPSDIDDKGKAIVSQYRMPEIGFVAGDEVLKSYLTLSLSELTTRACDKLFKKKLITRSQLIFRPGLKLSEDSLFARMALSCADSVYVRCDVVGYYYRMRPGSAVHSKTVDMHMGKVSAWGALYDWYNHLGFVSAGLRKVLAHDAYALLFVGIDDTTEIREACRRALVVNDYFNDVAVLFGIAHQSGRYKMMLMAYRICGLARSRYWFLKILDRFMRGG